MIDGFAHVLAAIAIYAGQFGVEVAHGEIVVGSGFIRRRLTRSAGLSECHTG